MEHVSGQFPPHQNEAFNKLYDVIILDRQGYLLSPAAIPNKKARKVLKIKKNDNTETRDRSKSLAKKKTPLRPDFMEPPPTTLNKRRRAGSVSVKASKKTKTESSGRKRSKSRLERFVRRPSSGKKETKVEGPKGLSGMPVRVTVVKQSVPILMLPERQSDGSVVYKNVEDDLSDDAKTLKVYYNNAKPDIQILINTVLERDLPIDSEMSRHELYLYLKFNNAVPSVSRGYYGGKTSSEMIDNYLSKFMTLTALPEEQFEASRHRLKHLLLFKLFSYPKKFLASYLMLYIDMTNPMTEVYLIEVIQPLLPNCSRLDTQMKLFEFFSVTSFSKAEVVYIVLKMMMLINKELLELKKDAPSMVNFYQLVEEETRK